MERIVPEVYPKHNLRKQSTTSSSTGPDKKNRWSKYKVPAHSIHSSYINFTNAEKIFIYAVQGIDTEELGETQDGEFHLELLYEGMMQLASNMNHFFEYWNFQTYCNCVLHKLIP